MLSYELVSTPRHMPRLSSLEEAVVDCPCQELLLEWRISIKQGYFYYNDNNIKPREYLEADVAECVGAAVESRERRVQVHLLLSVKDLERREACVSTRKGRRRSRKAER